MAARAATFLIRRGDVAELAQAASTGTRSVFTQALALRMLEPGEGFGLVGYARVFLIHYLQNQGIWLGSEYATAEQAFACVAAVGGYILTPSAFSRIDDLNPEHHDELEIARSFAQLGVTDPDVAADGKTWLGILSDKMRTLDSEQALLVLVG